MKTFVAATMKVSSQKELKPENYQINAKICRLVEKFPFMYDRSHSHYLKKDIVDKAWVKISKEMDDSSEYIARFGWFLKGAQAVAVKVGGIKRERECEREGESVSGAL